VTTAQRQIPLFPEAREPSAEPVFSVRESSRARRLSIKVYPHGKVEVVVPRRTRAGAVQAFVEEHRDWIRRTRASFAEKHVPEPFRLPTHIELAGIGRTYGVNYRAASASKGVRYRQSSSMVTLSGGTSDSGQCVAALKRWLAGLARSHFGPELHALAAETGLPYSRIRVAGQKTRWGSHSSTGTISLNYCLLFVDPCLVRYLMIHELCHARHMNHSRRFWALVRRFEPDCRKLDRQLTEAWRHIPTWVGIY
jgi:predicted metal-dependent hydrolase